MRIATMSEGAGGSMARGEMDDAELRALFTDDSTRDWMEEEFDSIDALLARLDAGETVAYGGGAAPLGWLKKIPGGAAGPQGGRKGAQ